MNVILVAGSMAEAHRVCMAAKWPIGGATGPLVVIANDPLAVERIRGLKRGLCLLTEGAVRLGVPTAFITRTMMQDMTIMVMHEMIQHYEELAVKSMRIEL